MAINTIMKNGKKTAVLNIVIDPQKGFHDLGLTEKTGGVLYVPGGEDVVAPIGKLIKESRNSTFIISNDWHPTNHIADMTNHPGVMEFRKKQLREAGKSEDNVMNPVELPFSEIVLNAEGNIIGVKGSEGRIHKVDVKTTDGQAPSEEDRGRVTKVYDEYLDKKFDDIVGASTQQLWTPHCIQATESARMHDELNLPADLVKKMDDNKTKLTFEHVDPETGNRFIVVRKGVHSERDSNGLLVENDRVTMTQAEQVFKNLAKECRANGVEHVEMNFMGLATNFCVEFSANQVAAIANGYFDIAQMSTSKQLVSEACRGIPIPGGKDDAFSLDGTLPRLAEKYGFKETGIQQILDDQKQKPGVAIAGEQLSADGPPERKAAVG